MSSFVVVAQHSFFSNLPSVLPLLHSTDEEFRAAIAAPEFCKRTNNMRDHPSRSLAGRMTAERWGLVVLTALLLLALHRCGLTGQSPGDVSGVLARTSIHTEVDDTVMAAGEDGLRAAPLYSAMYEPRPGCEPVEHIPTIYIVSNRRSGTHMTVDLLFNSFAADMTVLKTNHIIAADGNMSCECLNWMRSTGKLVSPYRHFPDVAVSTYYYKKGFNKVFRERHKSFKSFVHSDDLAYLVKLWSTTVHSWMSLGADVMPVNFKDTTEGWPYQMNRVAAFLGLKLQPNAKWQDKENWKIVSQPVRKGSGKGTDGWMEVMSPEEEQALVLKARAHPVWGKNLMPNCKKVNTYVPNEICRRPNGDKYVVSNERDCVRYGKLRTNKSILKNGIQNHVCIPASCPRDMFHSLMVSRVRGNVLHFMKDMFSDAQKIRKGGEATVDDDASDDDADDPFA